MKKLNKTKITSESTFFRGSAKIEEELKSLEINKKRKEQDVVKILKYQADVETMKKNDERHQSHIQELRTIKSQVFEIRNEKEMKLKTLREKKLIELDNSEEERKKIEEKYMNNQRRMQEEILKEKQKRKEYMEKELANKKKRDEELYKMEKYNEELIIKANINKKLLDEKELKRQENIRQMGEKSVRENQEKSAKMKERIEQTLKNSNDKLIKQRVVFFFIKFIYKKGFRRKTKNNCRKKRRNGFNTRARSKKKAFS